jgi:hypothetical protein
MTLDEIIQEAERLEALLGTPETHSNARCSLDVL